MAAAAFWGEGWQGGASGDRLVTEPDGPRTLLYHQSAHDDAARMVPRYHHQPHHGTWAVAPLVAGAPPGVAGAPSHQPHQPHQQPHQHGPQGPPPRYLQLPQP
eukprot:scaffold28082_cov31-Phaeocystis_antarctica.AAC.2